MATPLGPSRLWRRSPAELLYRLRQLCNRVSEQSPWWTPLGAEPLPRRRLGDAAPAWPPAASSLTLAELQARWPDEARAIVREADGVRAGRFRLLGFEALDWGTPVDWHLEPLAGLRSPRQHWSRIPFLDVERVGDHKVVWELNRHQFLPTLAQAARVTGDRRYSDHAVELMLAWLQDNPPATGINWASSLEVAFRAISWLWALRLLDATDGIAPDARRQIDEGLYCHGRHLERYLSTYFSPNTHLTGEALGLLYLGTLMGGGPAPERWAVTGREVLRTELERQVQPDGTHFEQSCWYHRYTVDIYLHALCLGGWDGATERRLRERCADMTRALLHMTRPDGSVARLGDDDGGVLLRLDSTATEQAGGTLQHAALVLDTAAALGAGGSVSPALLWLAGPGGLARLDAMKRHAPGASSVHLSDAGWHVVRDGWRADSNWMLLDAGPIGGLAGGHGHADVLSLEVWVDGAPFLVDPGTGRYVGATRDQLRATGAHNTVTLGRESSSAPAGPFGWATRAAGYTVRREQRDRLTHIVAEHQGFGRLVPPAVHRRTVTAVEHAGWVIADRISGRADRAVTSHFQVATDCVISWIDGHPFVESARRPSGRGLLLMAAAAGTWRTRPGLVSPAYGVAEPASRLDFEWGGSAEDVVVLLLCCSRPGSVQAEWTAADAGLQLDAVINDTTHHLLVNPRGESRANGRWHTDAEVMWVREQAGSVDVTIDRTGPGAPQLVGAG